MEYFSNDLFKQKSPITYVHVQCYVIVSASKDGLKTNSNKYEGYIEVPYSYDLFTKFSEKQQIAICEAVLCKSGICTKLFGTVDPNKFFE
jgi:hypothetical protein